jgi:preprotein translocase subunit SecG
MSVNLLLIFFVLVVVAMIAFILVQKGTGATAGSAFGSGASSTVFGAKGSGNFLTKTTMMLAFLFFALSMFMAVQASKDFTVAAQGEIDLGVVGTLDTSASDVPVLKPEVNEGDAAGLDVPSLDNESAEVPTIDQVENVLDNAEDLKDDATEVLEDATEAVEEIKQEATEALDDLEDKTGN